MLEFKELEYILTIARHGNITKAARELYIAQPSLTKYLQNLEKVLGIKLFSRMGNRLALTYAGERYAAHAREIMLHKRELEAEIFDLEKNRKGRINIAFPYARGSYIIPATLPRFAEKYPGVEVNLFEDSSAALEKLVVRGEADIAIFNNYERFNPDLDYEVIGREEIALAVGRGHPLSGEGEPREECRFPWIDLKRFKDDKFLLHFPFQRTGQISDSIFRKEGFVPANVMRIRSIDAVIRLAAMNFGVCFATENHLKYLDRVGFADKPIFFSIGTPNTTMDLVVVSRKNAYLPQYVVDYVDIVKEELSG